MHSCVSSLVSPTTTLHLCSSNVLPTPPSYIKQFSNTSPVYDNLTQFCLYPPDPTGSVPCPTGCPPPLQMPITSPRLSSVLLINYKSGFPDLGKP